MFQPIAPDIYQVSIPIPFRRLGALNSYLIRAGQQWTIIDTGLNTTSAREAWQTVFEQLPLNPAHITQIILTHTHPDHFGLAGWLQQTALQAGAKQVSVNVSERDAQFANNFWLDPEVSYEATEFWERSGLPNEIANNWVDGMNWLRQRTLPHPTRLEPLSTGASLPIGGYCFEVLHTPGHSDGHLALYDADQRLMVIGDQVLTKITPNIGLWPTTQANPLGAYLTSLSELRDYAVRLALPGHRQPIGDTADCKVGWQDRISQLREHHDHRLAEMYDAVGSGATAFTVSQHAFDYSTLKPDETRFAVAETLAHLDYLVATGDLTKRTNGVWWYEKN